MFIRVFSNTALFRYDNIGSEVFVMERTALK